MLIRLRNLLIDYDQADLQVELADGLFISSMTLPGGPAIPDRPAGRR
jgi:hypothetical protein